MPIDHDDPVVPFTYTHSITYFPHAGGGKLSGNGGTLAHVGHARIRTVTSAQAPLVASLERPDGLGTLDVRMVQGVLMRPLRAPGSWEPCDLDTFVESLRGASKWRDSPIFGVNGTGAHHGRPEAECARPLAHYAGQSRRVDVNERDRATAEAAALAALGTLVVVDGTVMAPTDEPVLVVGQEGDKGPVRVDWTFSDYGSQDDPAHGRTKEKPYQERHARGHGFAQRDEGPTLPPVVKNPFAYSVSYRGDEPKDVVGTFSLDRADDALALARLCAQALNVPMRDGPVVTHVDAGRVRRRDPFDLASRMVRGSFGKGGVERAWSELLAGPDEGVHLWLEARRLVRSLTDGSTVAQVAEALDAVMPLVDVGRAQLHQEAHAGILRWMAADRHRDPSLFLEANDPDPDAEVASFAP